MEIRDLSWLIGGPQGSGVDTAANIFAKACVLGGLHLFGKREYYSNIKGEHSYFTIRVSEDPVRSHIDDIDMLVAFEAETLFRHSHLVVDNGAIVFDTSILNTTIEDIHTLEERVKNDLMTLLKDNGKSVRDLLDIAKNRGVRLYGIPFHDLLQELASKRNEPTLGKLMRVVNVMTVSSSLALLDYEPLLISDAIRYIFRAKASIADLNIEAANYAYNYAKAKYEPHYRLRSKKPDDTLIMVQGSQAIGLGKIVGGCRFQTYYPITPASDESEFLESNEILELDGKGSVVVIQTEDEIAAITMAIGGALAGARSSTSTSGPGFSLMVEALGWAGINEVPVVVTLYQRAGPSTGLPTRHEQGDLLFAIHAGHGDFPRIVYSSGDVEESFYDSIRVFNYAERYQMPVIHLVDKALANSVITSKAFDPSRIKIDRGLLMNKVDTSDGEKRYLRFKLTENGISPRIRLGTDNAVFWNTGDEHNEMGHITEDPEIRNKMMEKRMGKLDLVLKDLSDEEKVSFYDKGSDMSIISWGSTKGAILDAIDMLEREKVKINFLQMKLLNPFPDISKLLKDTRMLIDIEMNYSAQLSRLIRANLQIDPDYYLLKYNGRPISSSELYHALKRIINGKAKRREVLTHGV